MKQAYYIIEVVPVYTRMVCRNYMPALDKAKSKAIRKK